jgi:CheY-like chemotaxis protein
MMQTIQDSVERAFLPTVVILADDLFFALRLEDVVRAKGGRPVTVETPELFVEAVDRYFPVLALVDLKTPGDWATAIQRSKMRPHTRAVPIYAFGSHVEVEVLKQARQAGADHAWARSRMMEEVVDIVGRHLDPPRRQIEGAEDPLSRYAVAGLLEFNRGEFFEQHEYLELAWMEEKRPIRDLYQGILQVGVAFLQIQRNNWPGAIKMFRRGLPRLRDLPAVCQGIELETFYHQAAVIHGEISQGGPSSIESFDSARFPQIQFKNPYKASTPAELGISLPAEE